jgi:hypothetical protein
MPDYSGIHLNPQFITINKNPLFKTQQDLALKEPFI